MKTRYVLIAIGAVLAITGLSTCGYGCSIRNKDAELRNLLKAKQEDNKNEFDNMWKKISQVAQVTDEQKNALKEIFVEHAKARTGSGGGGSIMKWVQESVPNVDLSVYKNLQNIITSARDAWTHRQKEILDIKREHDNLIDRVPSGWVLAILGRSNKVDVVIVTSSRTEKAFETRKDDDVQIFKK